MGLVKLISLHACISKWRIKCNRASAASGNFFEKIVRRLYKTNTCLSGLIFLPLIFPQRLWKYACLSFPVFSRTHVYASMEWMPCKQVGSLWGWTPFHSPINSKPDLWDWDCKLLFMSPLTDFAMKQTNICRLSAAKATYIRLLHGKIGFLGFFRP